MTDEEFMNSKKDRPFKFFGREFSKEDIQGFDWDECDVWLRLARQTVLENDQYAQYQSAKGTPIEGEELAKKIGFASAIKKFIFLLDDRQKRLGASRYKTFFDHCERELDLELFGDLCKEVDDILDAMPYEDPAQLRLE